MTTDKITPPRFSVVVPALNEESVLGDCLASLLAQTFSGPFEIIVVDNGSTDATAELATRYDVQVVSETRAGVCFARQRGLSVARGDIVVSTDADTTFSPGWLQLIDERFTAHPDAVAVAGPCSFVDGPWWSGVWQRALFGPVAAVARLTGRVGYVTATNLAFRQVAFDGYNTRLTQGGDELDVLRQLQQRGRVIFANDNPTFTSARRLHRGLLYNVVVSLGYYYVLGYLLNRVTGHRILGSAPSFRRPRPINAPDGADHGRAHRCAETHISR
ncbi:MAG: glycosyltransferase family A protein [Propionibacteriaceae bacterium]